MAKRKAPPTGKCVHCLIDNVPRNWDHVFPKSWYPDTTPENTSKWIIPSCIKCNSDYGKLEQDLMIRLSLCIDPNLAETSGIFTRTRRSLDASTAKNPKDAEIREANREKLLTKFLHGDEIPKSGIYPGLGERWGRKETEQIALTIPVAAINKLCEKIVRGIFYIEKNKFIEPPYTIDVHVMHEENAKEINNLLERFATTHEKGPGILVKMAITDEDETSGLFSILIWGSLKMYASVTN